MLMLAFSLKLCYSIPEWMDTNEFHFFQIVFTWLEVTFSKSIWITAQIDVGGAMLVFTGVYQTQTSCTNVKGLKNEEDVSQAQSVHRALRRGLIGQKK